MSDNVGCLFTLSFFHSFMSGRQIRQVVIEGGRE